MKLQIDGDTLTTDDVKSVLQRERDKARNENMIVTSVRFEIAGSVLVTDVDSVEYFSGKWIIVQTGKSLVYVPLAKINSISFTYEEA